MKIDISYWQGKNVMPRLQGMTSIAVCYDNQIRLIAKEIPLPGVRYYSYDFENDKDIILGESEEQDETL